ncbi:MAG TPA: glycosyltransferase family 9 protein [Pseudonocardiaceae bacterium]|nr:glycosyltransferase family 9 protein [Pseudonocardiaceae bacterium]
MAVLVALRALRLGDLLVAVPALRAVRRHWPRHRFVLAAPASLAPVARLAGCVDDVWPVSGFTWPDDAFDRPDVAVNLHGQGPESNAALDRLTPRLRVGHQGHGWSGPAWLADQHERERWCRMLAWHGVSADPDDLHLAPPQIPSPAPGAAVINVGASHGSRRWPVARFATVARALAEDGHRVVFTGTADERPRAVRTASMAGLTSEAVLAGRTGLLELAALVAYAGIVVTADTGVAHLSYAYGTPSVVLFGPAPAWQWGPPADGPHAALSADHLRVGDPFADTPDPALLGVSVADVLGAVATVGRQP